MSIRDLIADWVQRGDLVCLTPLIPSEPMGRTMFVSREIYDVVEGPWEQSKRGRQFATFRSDLDHFVRGGLISIAVDPYEKPKTTYLARVDPVRDEVWDIRSRDPKPGIRCMGAFSETDHAVMLTWNWRETLGQPDSKEWRDEIERCKASWRHFFPNYKPHFGREISDYVSTNFYAV